MCIYCFVIYIFDANCLAIVIFICLANTTYFASCIAITNDRLLHSDIANAAVIANATDGAICCYDFDCYR